MNEQTSAVPIAIVGGGLGGVVLAVGLLQRGVPFHIYEAAKGFGEIGAGVTFGPNAVRALASVSVDLLRAYDLHITRNAGDTGVFISFRQGTTSGHDSAPSNGENTARDHDHLFDIRGHITLPPGTTQGPKQQQQQQQQPRPVLRTSVHRARFLDEIVKLIPPSAVSFNKAVTSIQGSPDTDTDVNTVANANSAVTLHFTDGSSALASAVIGCDGIKSVTRSYVHGSGPSARP
ncbi:Salicylate hydroxylase [Madurella mycetomatis]|uniref:Salicylate hydroxylase n=1 Tax=Madurella mycetomatis TaxID=100816 RepID=A0A175W9S4_9PEZI|nr:Salicylate hydroxylase [Madurella mycetomatis]